MSGCVVECVGVRVCGCVGTHVRRVVCMPCVWLMHMLVSCCATVAAAIVVACSNVAKLSSVVLWESERGRELYAKTSGRERIDADAAQVGGTHMRCVPPLSMRLHSMRFARAQGVPGCVPPLSMRLHSMRLTRAQGVLTARQGWVS